MPNLPCLPLPAALPNGLTMLHRYKNKTRRQTPADLSGAHAVLANARDTTGEVLSRLRTAEHHLGTGVRDQPQRTTDRSADACRIAGAA